MTEKPIKTFEDAIEAIEKLKTCPLPCCSLTEWNKAIDKALEILRELKASVKEDLNALEDCAGRPEATCKGCRLFGVCDKEKILRRLLEGEK